MVPATFTWYQLHFSKIARDWTILLKREIHRLYFTSGHSTGPKNQLVSKNQPGSTSVNINEIYPSHRPLPPNGQSCMFSKYVFNRISINMTHSLVRIERINKDMQLILYSPGIWVIHRIFYPRSTLSDTPQGSGSLGLLLPLHPLVLASEISDIVALPGD